MLESRIAIYPGTFDPMTKGHLDVISRASCIVDRLIIGISGHSSSISKKIMFSPEMRKQMVSEAVASMANIEVKIFDGLLVNFARKEKAKLIIRGLRAVSDFEYEFKMAWLNHRLAQEIETVFFTSSEETQFISSQFIKEIIALGGDCSEFVPPSVLKRIQYNKSNDSKD